MAWLWHCDAVAMVCALSICENRCIICWFIKLGRAVAISESQIIIIHFNTFLIQERFVVSVLLVGPRRGSYRRTRSTRDSVAAEYGFSSGPHGPWRGGRAC